VSLPSSAAQQAVLVPRDAVMLREPESYVVVIDEEMTAHRVTVRLGTGVDTWISVIGAVHQGDKVVIRGAENLKEGAKVRVTDSSNQQSLAAY